MSARRDHFWGDRMRWLEVRACDVRVGDLYANGATVTEVVRGPRPARNPNDFANVKRGEVLLYCGESFAARGKAGRSVIVGRLQP